MGAAGGLQTRALCPRAGSGGRWTMGEGSGLEGRGPDLGASGQTAFLWGSRHCCTYSGHELFSGAGQFIAPQPVWGQRAVAERLSGSRRNVINSPHALYS